MSHVDVLNFHVIILIGEPIPAVIHDRVSFLSHINTFLFYIIDIIIGVCVFDIITGTGEALPDGVHGSRNFKDLHGSIDLKNFFLLTYNTPQEFTANLKEATTPQGWQLWIQNCGFYERSNVNSSASYGVQIN